MKVAVLIASLLVGVRAVALPENDQTNTYKPPQKQASSGDPLTYHPAQNQHQGKGPDPGESKMFGLPDFSNWFGGHGDKDGDKGGDKDGEKGGGGFHLPAFGGHNGATGDPSIGHNFGDGTHFKLLDMVLPKVKKALGWQCPDALFKQCIQSLGGTSTSCIYAFLLNRGSVLQTNSFCLASFVGQAANTPKACQACIPPKAKAKQPAGHPHHPHHPPKEEPPAKDADN